MTTFMGDAEFAGDAIAGNKIVQVAAAPLAEPPRQLPLDVPDFTGRGEAIAKLDAMVDGREKDSYSVFVAITGMPGVGKTALAVHWSHRMASHFPDGHLFIDLRGYSERAALSPQEALGQALRALGVPGSRIPADGDEAAALYRTQLAAREMLVVLDDAAGAQQVQPLIPGSSSCLVVVTSRNDLGGLVARAGARTVPLDVLPAAEALDLVRAVAGRERTEAEPEAAETLIQGNWGNISGHLPRRGAHTSSAGGSRTDTARRRCWTTSRVFTIRSANIGRPLTLLRLRDACDALRIETEVNDHFGRSVTLSAIDLIYADMGRFSEALDYLDRALDVKRDIGDLRGEVIMLRRLAALQEVVGHATDARNNNGRATRIEAAARFDPPISSEEVALGVDTR